MLRKEKREARGRRHEWDSQLAIIRITRSVNTTKHTNFFDEWAKFFDKRT